MLEGLWVPVITGSFTILGTIVSNMLTGGKTRAQILCRIECLEKKQDKYNNLQERMARVEESSKSAHKRLDEYGARL